jgi:hypothetical protein
MNDTEKQKLNETAAVNGAGGVEKRNIISPHVPD